MVIIAFCESDARTRNSTNDISHARKKFRKEIRVILDPSYGFEGVLSAVTREPSGIWLSDAEAIILRATIAQPIPQVAGREERSEIFVHLNSVQRIEVLHAPSRR